MKKNIGSIGIILFLTLITVYACNKKENTTEIIDKNYNLPQELEEILLEGEAEKITLLSLIHKIPADSLHLILKDYNSKTWSDHNYKYLDKVIDTISEKFRLPKSKIALMIYNFKYNSNNIESNLNENNDYMPDTESGRDSESGYRY